MIRRRRACHVGVVVGAEGESLRVRKVRRDVPFDELLANRGRLAGEPRAMGMWQVLRRRVRGPRHPHAVRAREGAEVVVECVVLFDDDDHVVDLVHGNRSPRDVLVRRARKALRPSNPTRLSRLRNRQVENLLIPRVHGLRGATQMPQAVIVGAVRTPIGKRAGSLKDWRPDDLAAFVLRALADRTGIEPKIVEDVVLGCVTQVDEQGLNIARLAPLIAGFPESVPGTSVNRMCASGLQAFNFAAMEVMTGQNDVVIAGGVEVMSRVPLGSDAGALSPKLSRNTRSCSKASPPTSSRTSTRSPGSRWTNSRSGPTARRSGRSMRAGSRRRSNPSPCSTRMATNGCSIPTSTRVGPRRWRSSRPSRLRSSPMAGSRQATRAASMTARAGSS